MYHYVRKVNYSRYPQIRGLEYKRFKKQLDYFIGHYSIIKMEDLIDAIYSDSNLPDNGLLLTFDDGYIDHFQSVYPLLKNNHLQGSFFVPGKVIKERKVLDVNKIHFILACGNVDEILYDLNYCLDHYRGSEYSIPSNRDLYEQYALENRFDNGKTIFIKRMLQDVLPEKLRNMITDNLFEKYVGISERKFAEELYVSGEQLRCMKDGGMFIGIHGYEHYWMEHLEQKKMKEDVDKALEVLGDFIDKDAWVMNYPYGSYNNGIIDYISTEGCCLGLTTEVRKAKLGIDNRYLLPRLDTNDFPPNSNNFLNYDEETDDGKPGSAL